MERRLPSVTSSFYAADRSSIRRRSGNTNSEFEPDGFEFSSEPSSPSGTGLIEDNSQDRSADGYGDILQHRPTVLLVHPPHPSRRHPSGPQFPLWPLQPTAPAPAQRSDCATIHHPSDGEIQSPHVAGSDLLNLSSPVPSLESSTLSHYQSSESLLSLPSPDFSVAHNRSFRSILPRHLDFLSFGEPFRLSSSAFTMVTSAGRPPNVRTESGYSTSSANSGTSSMSSRSSNSADTGHSSLIPSIVTTEKFTNKWPRPQSLRYLQVGNNDGGKPTATDIFEAQGFSDKPSDKWTLYKWCLLMSVFTVFLYGTACLAYAIMVWVQTWRFADVMYTADNDVLILITLTGSLLVFTSLLGTTGVVLNSRPLLAIYAFVLWLSLSSMVTVGYVTYKRSTFALDHKLDWAWSQWYTPDGRLLIQNSLRCCGYYNALHDATPSKYCYVRTPLPGCKGKLYRFEKENLDFVFSAAFSLVPLHIVNIMVALLCANHITKTFGLGIIPTKYRLTPADVKGDVEKVLTMIQQMGLGKDSRFPAS